ncbi:MAG: hypothetical protein IJQ32_09490, partial [Paludibacteraceae bacterium]|nr:hypothetical protein [Paludibacteraceae bacterium]
SAKNVLPRTHAFAFPIRKRMFLPEHIRQCGCKGNRLTLIFDFECKGKEFLEHGQIVCPKVRKRGEFLSLSKKKYRPMGVDLY